MRKALRFWIMFSLVGLTSCRGSAGDPIGEMDGALADDSRPTFLPWKSSPTRTISLSQTETIQLRPGEERPIRHIVTVSIAPEAIYIPDRSEHVVRVFNRSGEFLGNLGDGKGIRLQAPHAAIYSPVRKRILVADVSLGLVVFGSSRQFERIIQISEVDHPFSVSESSNGDLLVLRSSKQRHPLVLVRSQRLVGSLYTKRWPEGMDYRHQMFHLYSDTDAEGNIYVGSVVDYEIRKYDPDGRYLADFKLIEDPLVRGPDSVDPDTALRLKIDRGFHDTWIRSWTQVRYMSVLADRWLVVCLAVHAEQRYRLHFYDLNGTPLSSPLSWDYPLVGDDEQGRLYFARIEDSPALLVCELEGLS